MVCCMEKPLRCIHRQVRYISRGTEEESKTSQEQYAVKTRVRLLFKTRFSAIMKERPNDQAKTRSGRNSN